MVAVQKPHETEPVQRRAVKEHLLVTDPHEPVSLAFIVPDQLALADLQVGVSGLFHNIFSHRHMSHGTRHTHLGTERPGLRQAQQDCLRFVTS